MRPTKMVIIKITNKMKSVKTGPTGILLLHCWWEYKFIQPINVWHLLPTKVDIHFEHCDPGISLLGRSRNMHNKPSQKFQSRIIHNIPELETIQTLTVIYELWSIHTMVQPYNMKMNKLLLHASHMLNGGKQTQKNTNYTIHLLQ